MGEPHIDGVPLEEFDDRPKDLPDEPDISIPLDAPDAIERLEELQDEVAMSHTGRPMPDNPESHEVTQEDEAELETALLTHDIQGSLREQGYFNQKPESWLEDIVLEDDANELITLNASGFDEHVIEDLITKMSEEYPARFKKMNGGTSLTNDPSIQKINLTKEEYRDRLRECYLTKLIKDDLAEKSPTETEPIDLSQEGELIELGEPIDDEEEVA